MSWGSALRFPFSQRPATPRLVLGDTQPGWLPLPVLRKPLILEGSAIHQHKHVIGLTGQGKSKLLATLFAQLHAQGIAGGVIDPHADLAHDCLQLLLDRGLLATPAQRARLLYVDFSRSDAYLPFNVLQGPYDAHTTARHLVEVCKRAWPALGAGAAPTFENILLHATVVLVENQQPLTILSRLLTDKLFRDMSLKRVQDEQVVRFFHERYDAWGREGALMRESTLNRVALLTFSPSLRYTLGQPDNALDFRRHLDEGISVIYNLDGLDEATQTFLGCLLTVGYEMAALSRADQPVHTRRPWHLTLDEFSQFSATTETALARVLSLCRKYGLYLTLAHQTFSQVSERLAGALQNTLGIAFRLGRSDAEWAAKRFGHFDAAAIKHAIGDPVQAERSHPLFVSLPEAFERWTAELETLQPRQALVKHGPGAIKVRTPAVPAPRTSRTELEQLMAGYRAGLLRPAARVRAEVDRAMAADAFGVAGQPVTRRVTLSPTTNQPDSVVELS